MGFAGWCEISQRYSEQGYKENVLYHTEPAITVIYIYIVSILTITLLFHVPF